MASSPTIASLCDALTTALEVNQPVTGDCEKIAALISAMQIWYSQKCPLV